MDSCVTCMPPLSIPIPPIFDESPILDMEESFMPPIEPALAVIELPVKVTM